VAHRGQPASAASLALGRACRLTEPGIPATRCSCYPSRGLLRSGRKLRANVRDRGLGKRRKTPVRGPYLHPGQATTSSRCDRSRPNAVGCRDLRRRGQQPSPDRPPHQFSEAARHQ
jgi:hypothetical protein